MSSYLAPGISITVRYFCGKVEGPPPTSMYLWSCEIFAGNPGCTPLFEDEFAGKVDVIWILLVLDVPEFARARLLASSKESNLVGVEMASDLGLNFFGDPTKLKIHC